MTLSYSIADVAPYINWIYFDYAWGMNGKPEAERQRLRHEAEDRMQRYADRYRTHAVFELFDCYSDNDDIIVANGERIPCLRQQQQDSDYLCLSDFISPLTDHRSPLTTKIGVFATSVDSGIENDFSADPYEKMMMQLVAAWPRRQPNDFTNRYARSFGAMPATSSYPLAICSLNAFRASVPPLAIPHCQTLA